MSDTPRTDRHRQYAPRISLLEYTSMLEKEADQMTKLYVKLIHEKGLLELALEKSNRELSNLRHQASIDRDDKK